MKVFTKRPKDLGILIVVGGPGGSGASTIAKMVAKHFGLHYVYGGNFMRSFAKSRGFDSLEEFQGSDDFQINSRLIDRWIDKKIVDYSYKPNVLIDSKVFAGISTNMQIPCTVKIWITASLEKRVRRTLHKQKKVLLSAKLSKKTKIYKETMSDLMKRFSNDSSRYRMLYGIDYEHPKKYNDLVIDSSAYTAGQTFELILEFIKDGEYIK